jgi:hypothetical protein
MSVVSGGGLVDPNDEPRVAAGSSGIILEVFDCGGDVVYSVRFGPDVITCVLPSWVA